MMTVPNGLLPEKLPTYKYEATQYGEYMLNQLYELLTDYGTIDEVWFDGAQGNTSSTEFYDYNAFYDLIGKLQPNAIQANAAPDARWIGNEDGWARTTEWNPQAVGFDQHGRITLYPAQTARDGVLGSTDSVIEGIVKVQLPSFIGIQAKLMPGTDGNGSTTRVRKVLIPRNRSVSL